MNKLFITIDPSLLQKKSSERIDLFLARVFPDYSRIFFQKAIARGAVEVNAKKVTKPGFLVRFHDTIVCDITQEAAVFSTGLTDSVVSAQLRSMLVFNHKDFLVLNKPAGLVVHRPHSKSPEHSLVDLLVQEIPTITSVGQGERPGIVHRLDKDTSGLLLVAKNQETYLACIELFKNRLVSKKYYALVHGHTAASGSIDYPVQRNSVIPTKMTHKDPHGRPSLTHFVAHTYFKDTTLLELLPHTGRTHQLRVHCTAIGHPIVGDLLYGTASKLIKRQALHAAELDFTLNGHRYNFKIDFPNDFKALLALQEKI